MCECCISLALKILPPYIHGMTAIDADKQPANTYNVKLFRYTENGVSF